MISKIGKTSRIGVMKPGRVDTTLPGADRAGVRKQELLPEEVKQIARMIGDTRAKEVWKLMQRGIVGSLPELCTYDWLEKRHLSFDFQSSLLGGRRVHGGAVVDFVLYDLSPQGYTIWRVQGSYWHAGKESEARDRIQKFRLGTLKLGGMPVQAVVDIWEDRIYRDYPRVFLKAEAGQEMGPM